MGRSAEAWQDQQDQDNLSGMDDYECWVDYCDRIIKEQEEILSKTRRIINEIHQIVETQIKPF